MQLVGRARHGGRLSSFRGSVGRFVMSKRYSLVHAAVDPFRDRATTFDVVGEH
jgi:hypothetical protein